MSRWLGVCAAFITISAVILVLHWGTSGRAGTPAFELAVLILSITTPLASLLLTWHLWRDGYRGGALLSSSPLLLMAGVAALALLGAAPSLNLLLWLDLYVLLAFVVVLGGRGRQILRLSSHRSNGVLRCMLALVAGLTACGMSDSGARTQELEAWSIAPAPSLIISSHEQEPLYQVRGLSVSPARIAVAVGGSQSVAIFDAAGRPMQSVGRKGAGPGEFESLSDVFYLADDSLLTFDSRLRRFQVFDSDGNYVRTFTFSADPDVQRTTFPIAVLRDGVILARQVKSGADLAEKPGITRSMADVLRFSSDGLLLDTVAVVLGWEAYNTQVDGIFMTNVPVPFSNSTYMSGAHDRFVLASSDSNSIMMYSFDGNLLAEMRDVAPRGPRVAPAEIEAFRSRVIAGAPPPAREHLEAVYAEMPFPTAKAPFNWVAVGRDSSIWLRLARPGPASQADSYIVFDDSGAPVAEVQLPVELSPGVVSRQSVLGVWTDSLGVESVRAYDVLRQLR